MTTLPEFPNEKAMYVPLGAASPLWMMYAGAASLGVALWWSTRWMRPVNLEAVGVLKAKVADATEAVETAVEQTVELAQASVEAVAETVETAAADLTETVVEATPEPVEVIAAVIPEPVAPEPVAPEPVAEAPVAAPVTPDDLTRLVGVGPKLAVSLAARGVTSFAQIAAWTADDLAKVDTDLKLLGRASRDAWVAQAKRFLEA